MRPIIVMDITQMVNNNKVDLVEDMIVACYFSYQILLRVCFVAGKVEQCVVVLDLSGLSIYSIPITLIARIVKALNKYFLHMADNIFIFNAPAIVIFSWTLIKQCFNEETNKRIQFATTQNNIILNYVQKE